MLAWMLLRHRGEPASGPGCSRPGALGATSAEADAVAMGRQHDCLAAGSTGDFLGFRADSAVGAAASTQRCPGASSRYDK